MGFPTSEHRSHTAPCPGSRELPSPTPLRGVVEDRDGLPAQPGISGHCAVCDTICSLTRDGRCWTHGYSLVSERTLSLLRAAEARC